MNTCPVCKDPVDVCPYGGDCGEMQLIARERQRQINADIDVSDMDDCVACCGLAEHGEMLCYSCQTGCYDGDDLPFTDDTYPMLGEMA